MEFGKENIDEEIEDENIVEIDEEIEDETKMEKNGSSRTVLKENYAACIKSGWVKVGK